MTFRVMEKNLENCIIKQTHERHIRETHQRVYERALLFPTEEETNKELRESRATALSRKLSLKRSHHSGGCKNGIHSFGESSFSSSSERARKFTKFTRRRLSAGKKRRATTKNAKGRSALT